GFGQRFGNSQAKSEPAKTPLQGTLSLFKGVENSFHRFRLDPDTVILHNYRYLAGRLIHGRNHNQTLVATKLDRVLDQVPNNLLKPRFIGYDETLAGGEIQLHLNLPSRPFTSECLHHVK